jgi:predicted HicB family RNase H-like nuclease
MATLMEKLGEEGYEELGEVIVEKIRIHSVSRDEFEEILEKNVAELKTEIRNLREEFKMDVMELRKEFKMDVTEMRKEFKMDIMELRKEMNDLRREMNVRFDNMYERITSLVKWTVGTLALFGTIITILYAIGLFIK